MAGAAKITVAEVEELVPAGELDPNQIHIPGILFNEFSKVKSTRRELNREQ